MAGYDVIILRFRANVNRAELPIPGLQRVFGVDRETALKVVHSVPCVVRSSVDLGVAERYAAALRSLGGEVQLRQSGAGSTPSLLPQPAVDTGPPPPGAAAQEPPSGSASAARPTKEAEQVSATEPAPAAGPDKCEGVFDTTAESPAPGRKTEAARPDTAGPARILKGGSPTYPLGTIDAPGQGGGIADLPTQPDAGQLREEAMKMMLGARAAGDASPTVVPAQLAGTPGAFSSGDEPGEAKDAGVESRREEPGQAEGPREQGPPGEPPAQEPARWDSIDLEPVVQQADGQPHLSSDTEGGLAAHPSPTAWMEDDSALATGDITLDLADTGPERRRPLSSKGAGAREDALGDTERPPVGRLGAEVRKDEGAATEVVPGGDTGFKGGLKAPDPMRAAVISDEVRAGQARSGGKHAAADEPLALAVEPGSRVGSLTIANRKENELPAPLRAAAAHLSFFRPGMGDALGGLAIVALGLWVGGSIFLGSPGVTDVMFDAGGIGWFLIGVYRLTAGSRSE